MRRLFLRQREHVSLATYVFDKSAEACLSEGSTQPANSSIYRLHRHRANGVSKRHEELIARYDGFRKTKERLEKEEIAVGKSYKSARHPNFPLINVHHNWAVCQNLAVPGER